MKKKIIISLPVSTDKCRALAMKIAVSTKGVKSVDIVEEKNHLVVNGEGIDSYILMKRLNKKFRCAEILTIEEVKSKDKDDKDKDKEKKKKDDKDDKDDEKKKEKCKICPICCKPYPCYCRPYPPYPVYQPVYDTYSQGCSIV
ncbi:PREDICTED: heavy metal-associated isoprenylated plant protein 16-like [Ipomoea nil]|uniref:heavy metal-associated isoprenylated plant protein 16-like n=1 Tax=Ipomoea nil TaxID=35883 RepID=UPI000900B07E|nr:PREDICTED: heavy metal-associated isoprenylated plant protein 16-like [Ipomoea nil]